MSFVPIILVALAAFAIAVVALRLPRAGWTFWRVFGSQWNANKAFWWKNLQEALARMQIGPIGAA